MRIEEFLAARLAEAEEALSKLMPTYQAKEIKILKTTIEQQKMLLEWNGNWPTLVEERPEVRFGDYEPDVNKYSVTISQQLTWMTNQQYVEQFGDVPPTAPLLCKMVQLYRGHPDYDPSWG